MQRAIIWLLVALLTSLLWCTSSFADIVDEDVIKCKVCLRAVEHMWHRGDILRMECRQRDMDSDERCHLGNLQRGVIDELVRGTCEELPHSYQAVEESEFDLVLHDNPKHEKEVVEAISNACTKWIHDEHTVEKVALYIFSNLDARKKTNEVLYPLQQKFCLKPCGMKPIPPRKRRAPHYHHHQKEDYSHAIRVEKVAAEEEEENIRRASASKSMKDEL